MSINQVYMIPSELVERIATGRFLRHSGLGLGWLAAADLFNSEGARRDDAGASESARAEEAAACRPRAKSVISLFMQGGPSHIDTFDPKPLLIKLNGQHPPESFGDADFQDSKFRDTRSSGFADGRSRNTASRASMSRTCFLTLRSAPTIWR